jgi:hypothetical protein
MRKSGSFPGGFYPMDGYPSDFFGEIEKDGGSGVDFAAVN